MKLALYGSLRLGQYNYRAFCKIFGKKNFKHLGTKTITGFQLFSLGAYPTIIESPLSTLVVDLFEVSEEVFYAIDAMELGAGYERQNVVIDGENYGIYYMEKLPAYIKELVPSGDWSLYLSGGMLDNRDEFMEDEEDIDEDELELEEDEE